tara:strand:- start:1212 stop:1385 length:174 start_codon:yes stop_codon:yes gene_type:complete
MDITALDQAYNTTLKYYHEAAALKLEPATTLYRLKLNQLDERIQALGREIEYFDDDC